MLQRKIDVEVAIADERTWMGMEAVLYVCHGSRTKEGQAEAQNFVKKAMKFTEAPIQECCFLELAEPSIYEGFERCIRRGAKRVAVVPVLLLTANHAKKDIPEILQALKSRYPETIIRYGQPLGVQERIVDVLAEKISEKSSSPQALDILLVGRGSSDQEAVADTRRIADLLRSKKPYASVQVGFLAAAEPKFHDLLRHMAEADRAKQIVIVPYLLFNGMLMKDIRQAAANLKLEEGQQVIVCDYLGDHPHLLKALSQRAHEALRDGMTIEGKEQ